MALNFLDKLPNRHSEQIPYELAGKRILIAISSFMFFACMFEPLLLKYIPYRDLLSPVIALVVGGEVAILFCLAIIAGCTSLSLKARLIGTVSVCIFVLLAFSLAPLVAQSHRTIKDIAIIPALPFWLFCATLPLLLLRYLAQIQIVFPQFPTGPLSKKFTISDVMTFTTVAAFVIGFVSLGDKDMQLHVSRSSIVAVGIGCLMIPLVGIMMSSSRPLILGFAITTGLTAVPFIVGATVPVPGISFEDCYLIAFVVASCAATVNSMLLAFRLLGATLLRNRSPEIE